MYRAAATSTTTIGSHRDLASEPNFLCTRSQPPPTPPGPSTRQMAANSSGGGVGGLLPETTSASATASSSASSGSRSGSGRQAGSGGGATRTVLGVLLVGAAVAVAVVFGGGQYRQVQQAPGGTPKMDTMAVADGGLASQVDTPPIVTAALGQDKQATGGATPAQINTPPLPALDAASDAASGVLKSIMQPQLTGPIVSAAATVGVGCVGGCVRHQATSHQA